MAWPFTRLRTYAAGSQVPSADLNALQDEHLARRNRKIFFPAAAFALGVNGTQTVAGNVGAWLVDYDGSARKITASGADTGALALSPHLLAGDVIKELTFFWRNGVTPAAGSIALSLSRATGLAALVAIGSLGSVDTNTGGASVRRSSTIAVGHTVLVDNFYAFVFEMDATAGNDQAGVQGVAVTIGV